MFAIFESLLTIGIAGQDVDLRTLDRQIDPRMARMDQDLRGLPPVPPPSINSPTITPSVDNRPSVFMQDS